eukprot:gene6042-8319_t
MMLHASTLILFTLCIFFRTYTSQSTSSPLKDSNELRGVILLDSTTFPKIIPSRNNQQTFLVLITNKAYIGDYGTNSIRGDYFKFAQSVDSYITDTNNSDNIVFCQVILNGAENQKLVSSILGSDEEMKHPKLVLFTHNSSDISDNIVYPSKSPFTMNALTRFIMRYNPSFYIQIPGTLKIFDEIAKKFMGNISKNHFITITNEAKETLLSLTLSSSDENKAKYYIKIMEKISSSDIGINYITKEMKRLNKLIDEDKKRLSKQASVDINEHLNVLQYFLQFIEQDEVKVFKQEEL